MLNGKWKSLGQGVFESASGIRIHIGGQIVRTLCGDIYRYGGLDKLPEINQALRRTGGNKRRAMMLVAESNFNCK